MHATRRAHFWQPSFLIYIFIDYYPGLCVFSFSLWLLFMYLQILSTAKVLIHVEAVFPSSYVGRKLIPILAVIATHITLKRIAEPMTTHVDGIHYMV